MSDSELMYFTHAVDGACYGAWYRVMSSTQLEVLGAGILEAGEYGGYSPEESAKSILENFVRLRIRMGSPIPSLETLEHQGEKSDQAEEVQPMSNDSSAHRTRDR
jgi:hypothetical protein